MATKTWGGHHDPSRAAGASSTSAVSSPPLPASEQAAADLLEAFQLLMLRGAGEGAWAAPFRDHPIAFLLDSMGDAANLWDLDGHLIYRNRAASELEVGSCEEASVQSFTRGGRCFERRCLRCHVHSLSYVLEIVREVKTPTH